MSMNKSVLQLATRWWMIGGALVVVGAMGLAGRLTNAPPEQPTETPAVVEQADGPRPYTSAAALTEAQATLEATPDSTTATGGQDDSQSIPDSSLQQAPSPEVEDAVTPEPEDSAVSVDTPEIEAGDDSGSASLSETAEPSEEIQAGQEAGGDSGQSSGDQQTSGGSEGSGSHDGGGSGDD